MTTHTKQPTHHWIITLEVPGRASISRDGTCTLRPGDTRASVLQAIRNTITEEHPVFRSANVLFFSIAPNQL
ncbi:MULTISPECIES: hypothetical protein [Streptomyces]|uniref:Uncharacterized protein n=1 Tax=Streptomyces fradiae ATCC 10745 = DSM 40063 TaxID=1319510 RepID=A0ABQ6XKK9_STRFR|nr:MULTISPECIES: hypothetical protein [Streptomyces]KAF0646314.1 hypothetical protein K701_29560 [Streptomyces fradiae ATCC 10745 = DSM 40063]